MPRFSKRRYSGPQKKEDYSYPTIYGSHSSMIDEEKTEQLNEEGKVVLKDEHGYYTTQKSRLDSGFADPNRYKTNRLIWYKKEARNA